MDILIAGDFFIADTFGNNALIENSITKLFYQADYRIINLEAPLTVDEPQNRILKTGPHLRMSAETIMPFLKQLKVDALTLANNHILDYGDNGLKDTFKVLKRQQIDYVGAGNNLNEATKPLSIEKAGQKIAILNFCENEWSIATEDSPGANPMDVIDNVNQIKEAKASHEKVICIIHGGHEYYHLPSPRMQKQYRFYADNGADAIVGHHTHCMGGYEIYNDVPIIYSLGNFIFTLPSKHEQWYSGLLAQLKIEKDKAISFKLLPIEQQKKSFKISMTSLEYNQHILKQVNEISVTLANSIVLKKKWVDFINNSTQYLNYFTPVNSIKNRYIKSVFFD